MCRCGSYTVSHHHQKNIPNDTICTLTEFFCHSVPLINYEVLIEDLEDLATL
jgi:hypothetical protein